MMWIGGDLEAGLQRREAVRSLSSGYCRFWSDAFAPGSWLLARGRIGIAALAVI
jgi:hypothetical protein